MTEEPYNKPDMIRRRSIKYYSKLVKTCRRLTKYCNRQKRTCNKLTEHYSRLDELLRRLTELLEARLHFVSLSKTFGRVSAEDTLMLNIIF